MPLQQKTNNKNTFTFSLATSNLLYMFGLFCPAVYVLFLCLAYLDPALPGSSIPLQLTPHCIDSRKEQAPGTPTTGAFIHGGLIFWRGHLHIEAQ